MNRFNIQAEKHAVPAQDLYDPPLPSYFASIRDLSESAINAIFDRAIYTETINSEAFKRLRDIRFLGAIDYVISNQPSRKSRWHTRYQHSLGVAQLALQYARTLNLSESDEVLLVVAGLLHDIGHAPLSHSLEPTFLQKFGIEHHEATEIIIKGKGFLGYPLSLIFRKHGVSAGRILKIISGDPTDELSEPFRGPINIDTIEAILRCHTYIASTGIAPWHVLEAFIKRDERVLDGFWEIKNVVYENLIGSDLGVRADYVCRHYMETAHESFWKGEYFQTEPALRKRHPELFVLLRDLRLHHFGAIGGEIKYTKRHFYIDKSRRLHSYNDMPKRYLQRKSEHVLSAGGITQ